MTIYGSGLGTRQIISCVQHSVYLSLIPSTGWSGNETMYTKALFPKFVLMLVCGWGEVPEY